jgi:hypothetical protein
VARAALARGDSGAAREQASCGIDLLRAHPLPFVGWRLYEVLGAACRKAGDSNAASAAFARALALVDQIAGGLDDPALRVIWSSSRDVRALRAAASLTPAQAVV